MWQQGLFWRCFWEGSSFILLLYFLLYAAPAYIQYLYLLCRCVLRAGVPPGLLHQPGAEVDGPEQPGHRGDWAGPSPLSAGPPRLSKPHRHRRTETSPHRLCSPQPQDRILSGTSRGVGLVSEVVGAHKVRDHVKLNRPPKKKKLFCC